MDLISIDDKVVFVDYVIDIDDTELKASEPHCSPHTPAPFLDELRMLCQQTFRDDTPDVRHRIGPTVHDVQMSTERPQFPLDAARRRRRLRTAGQFVRQHRHDLVGETQRRIDDDRGQVTRLTRRTRSKNARPRRC